MTRVLLFCLVLAVVFSCKPELGPEEQAIANLEKELELQPTPERANALLDELINYVSVEREDPEKVKFYLDKGLNVAKEFEINSRLAGFIVPLLKTTDDVSERKGYLLNLGDLMYDNNKRHASNVIYKELLITYPNDPDVAEKGERIDSIARVTPDYLGYLYQNIIRDPGEFEINKAASVIYIDAAEALALCAPQNKAVPEHLYKAAEVARSLRDLPKALSLYDRVLETYPDDKNAPTILFIKGFMMEQDFNQIEEARQIYTTFLEKYPTHQMASSVEFLLENLGKSEEEILEVIEQKRKQNSGN